MTVNKATNVDHWDTKVETRVNFYIKN